MSEKILVVEDEIDLQETLTYNLKRQGYQVEAAGDGQSALAVARSSFPNLIILDLMLPVIDGYEVCRILRQEMSTPILILTARDEEIDRVIGLEIGADDYLTKPFNPRELVARVKAILRRGERKVDDSSPIHLGDLTIDPARREVRLSSRLLSLRTQEFDLLLTLAEHRGRVLSREQILQKAWGFDFYGQTRTVDVHVAHLRRKIEGSSVTIETVTGIGYKLTVSS